MVSGTMCLLPHCKNLWSMVLGDRHYILPVDVHIYIMSTNIDHCQWLNQKFEPHKEQGQKGFQSTCMSNKAIRDMSSALKQSPILVLMQPIAA